MIQSLFGRADFIKTSLDGSWHKNQVIANNIANADTPEFKASTVNFEDSLKSAMKNGGGAIKKTREGHMDTGGTSGVIVSENKTEMRMDGNNVDMDIEQSNLAKNQIYYNMMTTQLNSELTKFKTVINGIK